MMYQQQQMMPVNAMNMNALAMPNGTIGYGYPNQNFQQAFVQPNQMQNIQQQMLMTTTPTLAGMTPRASVQNVNIMQQPMQNTSAPQTQFVFFMNGKNN